MSEPPSEQTAFMGGRTDKGRANRFRLDIPVRLRERGASYTGDLPAGVGLRFIDTPLRAAILANELRRSSQADMKL